MSDTSNATAARTLSRDALIIDRAEYRKRRSAARERMIPLRALRRIRLGEQLVLLGDLDFVDGHGGGEDRRGARPLEAIRRTAKDKKREARRGAGLIAVSGGLCSRHAAVALVK